MSENMYPVVVQLSANINNLTESFNRAQAHINTFADRVDASIREMARDVNQSIEQMATRMEQAFNRANQTQEDSTRTAARRISQLRTKMSQDMAKNLLATEEEVAAGITDRIKRVTAQAQIEYNRRLAVIMRYARSAEQRNALLAESEILMQQKITRVTEEETRRREARLANEMNNRREALRRGFLSVAATGTIAGMGVMHEVGQQTDVAREFDKNMHNVDSIAKLTTEKLKALSQEVLNYTREVPKTATDLSASLYEIYSSGFGEATSSQASALEAMKVSAEGAAAGLSTTEDAARVLTATANAYGMKTGPELNFIMDVLFKTVEKGVITFPELARSFGNVVSSGYAAGISVQDLGAALSVLTLKGLPASEAVTSLNSMITHITTPSEGAAKAAAGMGLAWFNAADSAKHLQDVGFANVLDEIAKATGGNIGKMHQLIPEIRGFRGEIKLAGKDADSFTTSFRAMQQSSFKMPDIVGAKESARARQKESYDAQITAITNALDRLRITMGSSILSVLVPLGEGLAKLGDAFNALPTPVKQFIAVLELLIGTSLVLIGVLGTLGVAVIGIDALLATTFGAAALTTISGWGSTLLLVLRTLLRPIAMVAAAVGVLWLAWKSNFGNIRSLTTELTTYIAYRFKWLTDAIMFAWEVVLEGTKIVWERLKTGAVVALSILDGLFSVFFRFIVSLMKAAIDAITFNWDSMLINLENAFRIFMGNTFGLVKDLFKGMGDIIQEMGPGISTMMSAVWEGLTSWKAGDAAKSKAKFQQGWSQIVSGVASKVGSDLEGIENSLDRMKRRGTQLIDNLKAPDLKSVVASYKPTDLPDRSLSAAEYAKRFGGKPTIGGRGQLDRLINQEIDEASAKGYNFEKMIDNLKLIGKTYQMTEQDHNHLLRRINDLTAKHNREAEALAKKGAAAVRKAHAEEQKKQVEASSTAFNQMVGEYKKFFGVLKAHYTAALAENKNLQKKAFDEELNSIEAQQERIKQGITRIQKGGGKQSTKESRINSLQGELNELEKQRQAILGKRKAIEDEQLAARQKMAQEASDIEERLEGDSFTRKIQKQEEQYRVTIRSAIKAGLSATEIAKQQALQEKAITKEKLDYIESLNDEAQKGQETAFEARLAKEMLGWDKLIEKAEDFLKVEILKNEKGAKNGEAIEKAKKAIAGLKVGQGLTRDRMTQENNLQVLQSWETTFGKMSQLWDNFNDQSATAADKLINATGLIFQSFKQEIANSLVPATKDLFSVISSFVAGNPILLVVAGVAAAGAYLFKLNQEREAAEKKVQQAARESNRMDRSNTQDRLDLISVEYEARMDQLNAEYEEAEAQGKLTQELYLKNMSERRAAAYKFEQDIRQLNLEKTTERLNIEANLQEAYGNKELAAEARKSVDILQIRTELQDKLSKGLISFATFQTGLRAAEFAAEQKHTAALIDIRLQAHQDLMDMATSLRELETDAMEHWLNVAKARGIIDEDTFTKSLGSVNSARAAGTIDIESQNIANIDRELKSGRPISPEKRLELERKLMDSIVKIQKAGYKEIEDEIKDYTDTVNASYKKIEDENKKEEDKLKNKFKRLKDMDDADLKHLKTQEDGINRIISLRDREIDKIKEKYDLLKEKTADSTIDEFRLAVANVKLGPDGGAEVLDADGKAKRVTYGPDNLTETGLKTQITQAKALYDLSHKTKEDREAYAKSVETAATMMGALAKQELDKVGLTYEEQVNAQDKLAEAQKLYSETRLELIGRTEAEEIKVQQAQKDSAQLELTALKDKAALVQETIDQVNKAQDDRFKELDDAKTANKTAWDQALEDIKTGMDPKIADIVAKFQPLENRIDGLIDKARELRDALQALQAAGPTNTEAQTNNWTSDAYTGKYGGANTSFPEGKPPLLWNPGKATPDASSVGNFNIPGMLMAASGGWARGGTPGSDSIPMKVQDGEYILDTSQASMISDMLAWFKTGMAQAGQMIQNNYFYFYGITDTDEIVEKVSRTLARG